MLQECDIYVSESVGLQLHVDDAGAQHDHPAGVTFLTGCRKVEQEASPDAKVALVVPLEPEPAEVDGIVQQHDVHGFAVPASGLEYRILDRLGAPPVPGGKAADEQPEQRFQSQIQNNSPCLGVVERQTTASGRLGECPLAITRSAFRRRQTGWRSLADRDQFVTQHLQEMAGK